MNRLLTSLSCACLLVGFLAAANAGTLSITSAADTMIVLRDFNGDPAGDGTSQTIAAGTDHHVGNVSRMLLRFNINISGIPTNATLTNVALRLVLDETPDFPPNVPFSLHRMLVPWDETNASWFSNGLGHAWEGAESGSDFVSQPSATNMLQGTGVYLFRDPALFNDVLLWITNSTTNYGWMFLCDTETVLESVKNFYAREATDPTVRPQLILEYSTPFSIQLTRPRKVGGQFAFDFAARPGTDYIIQYKDNVTNAWQEFDYYFDPGTETTFTVFDDGTAPKRFFRVISTTTP